LFAQREADNWFFGERVGLNFGTGGKPSVQTGKLNTLEGCASISDANGNLLFYSDGTTVWNRNHGVMPNGTNLLGDASSSQSAIIVPNPEQSNIYYLFTVGSTIVPSGFHYYTIDMNRDDGKGEVVGDAVNLSGDNAEFWSEKITAVETKTCDSYWVISMFDDVFYTYKVDENGVSTNPILSTVDFMSRQSRGYLKVSPNGSRIAIAHQGLTPSFSRLLLYSFDNETGIVSNDGIELYGPQNTNGIDAPYGVEFSPQSTKLYATTTDMQERYLLYQYDLESDDIPASITLIHEEDAFRGALQLGTDQKIYATIPVAYEEGTHFLDVIHYPEEKGLACTFEENYIDLGSGYAMQGLPPFIQSLFITEDINIVDPSEEVSELSSTLSICYNQSFTLEGTAISGANYSWTFESNGTVVDLPNPVPAHKLTINSSDSNVEGIYTLTVETNDDCDTKLIGVAEVSFMNPPEIASEATLQLCDRFDNDATDGISQFDLTNSLDDLLTGNQTNFTTYFYLNDQDAILDQNNKDPLPTLYTNTSQNQTITAKIYAGNTECYSLAQVHLEVFTSAIIIADDLKACDMGDGRGSFDLNAVRNQIKAAENQANLDIQFYALLQDAINEENPLDVVATIEPSQLYFIAKLNGLCYGSGTFMANIFSFPEFEPVEKIITCNNEFPMILQAPVSESDISIYDFTWSDGQLGHQIQIETEQQIDVTMIHKELGCKSTKSFEVINATVPYVDDVLINTQSNSIEVVSNDQNEPVFALGNPDGPYQSDPVFFNVVPGEYDLFVKNSYECEIISMKVYVFGVPKFFTPNNDGINDKWEIKGLDFQEFTFSEVFIFDRFGKHLYTFPAGETWDGSYNGELLPSNDYWYRFDVTNKNNETITYKGHFTLVRR
jgi:gliding motility-associated-like protein